MVMFIHGTVRKILQTHEIWTLIKLLICMLWFGVGVVQVTVLKLWLCV